MLVVCTQKDLRGFTYGRIYRIGYQADISGDGYTFVTNDKAVIVGEPKRYFKSIEDWRKCLKNRNSILWALTSGVL